MSIDISIKNGGVDTTMEIDQLNVPSLDSYSEGWIPTNGDTGGLVKVTTGENGTVPASDFDAYGISEIKVTQSGHHPVNTGTDSKSVNKHNTAITVGNRARIMPAKKLRVNLNGGGTSELMASSDVALTTLYVNEKGTYKAKDYDAYGFSEVTVDMLDGGITGDENGWDVAFDGEGLPDEIRITTLPTKTSYENGEIIDYSGIVVKAYKNNSVWSNSDYPNGVISFSELLFPQSIIQEKLLYRTSTYLESKGTNLKYVIPSAGEITYNLFTIEDWNNKHIVTSSNSYVYPVPDYSYLVFCYVLWVMPDRGPWLDSYAVCKNQFPLTGNSILLRDYESVTKTTDIITGETTTSSSSNSGLQFLRAQNDLKANYQNKNVYGSGVSNRVAADTVRYSNFSEDINISNVQGYSSNFEVAICWTLIYGETILLVRWSRPGDGAVLEATFPINVTTAST